MPSSRFSRVAYLESFVTNAGTINWMSGYLQLYNEYYYYYYYNGSIYNLAGATFNVLSDQPIYNYFGYEFIENDGTFRKSGTTGANNIQVLFTNTGTIDVESGTLQFKNTDRKSVV